MFSIKIGRSLVSAAAATLAVLLAVAAPASAYTTTGTTGPFSDSGVTCYLNALHPENNRVIVQAPAMGSSAVADHSEVIIGGGMYGGGFHVQQVGYRAYLYKWNGSTWAYTGRYGPLVRGQTGDALQPVLWRGDDSTWFSTPGRGYYKAALTLYWFADAKSGGGTATFMSRLYEQGRRSYCAF